MNFQGLAVELLKQSNRIASVLAIGFSNCKDRGLDDMGRKAEFVQCAVFVSRGFEVHSVYAPMFRLGCMGLTVLQIAQQYLYIVPVPMLPGNR